MIIPLSNGLLLKICLWLAFDSDELFIVQPPTPTTAPTLKSIVPLKPERFSPVAHLVNSHFKS